MQFTTLIATVAALAVGTHAAAIPRDGPRLAQFRVFGAAGCSELNYGFYTVDESDAGTCNALTNDPTAVSSVNLEHVSLPAGEGYSLFVYTDEGCSAGERAVSLNVCADVKDDGAAWKAWKIVRTASA
ncbi:hypothetical protein F4802DRAFT_607846 [Xylaria palmicola]|nr:hypothetical protein F4802DRAFT_607846 [Xylaria palmicola]